MQQKIIFKNYQCPGDICMIAHAIKSLHESHPGKFITDFHGNAKALFEGNPFIKKLNEKDPNVKTFSLEYNLIHQSNQKPVHFIHSFTEDIENKLNVKIKPADFQNFIYIRNEEIGWFSAIREKLGIDVPYWILDAGHKLDYTAKQWEYQRFQEIINRFPELTFVQIGLNAKGHYHPELKGDNLISLVGQTDDRQLVRLVYNAFGVITPVSFPMVLAYGVPAHPRFNRRSRACIVIAGGREPNHWQQGPNQQFLHTCGMLPCCDYGGCWKSRVVPIGDGDKKDENTCEYPVKTDSGQVIAKCMDMISVDEVCSKIKMYMDNLNITPEDLSQAKSAVSNSEVKKIFIEAPKNNIVKIKSQEPVINFLKSLPHCPDSDADYVNAENYYPVLNSLARSFKPESILEIGVRYGYSAISFLYNNKTVKKYVGLDVDRYFPPALEYAKENLSYASEQECFSNFDYKVFNTDTQNLESLDFLSDQKFDLIYVDGDHSYAGAYCDMSNFWNVLNVGGYILLDDYDFYKFVSYAAYDFVRLLTDENGLSEPHYNVSSFRGTYVIQKTKDIKPIPLMRSLINESNTSVEDLIKKTENSREYHWEYIIDYATAN